MTFEQQLIEMVKTSLTSYDVAEGNGVVEVNVCDAFMAIATAVNRLAAVQEKQLAISEAMQAHAMRRMQEVHAMIDGLDRVRQ